MGMVFVDCFDCLVDDGQCMQVEEVEFYQVDFFDVVFVELGDWVVVMVVFVVFGEQWVEFGQWFGCDYYVIGMFVGVVGEVFELVGQVDEVVYIVFGLVVLDQFG